MMDKTKEILLDQTYEKFIKIALSEESMDHWKDLIDDEIMAYGTAVDEKLLTLQDTWDLIAKQNEQVKSFDDFYYEQIPVHKRIFNGGNSAVIIEEINLTTVVKGEKNVLPLRLSTVMEYKNETWKVIHWHGSLAEHLSDGKDPWHVNEWKQKNEELQKLVDEKTNDILQKNRELEVEASLERVRSVAMGMSKSEDLIDICEATFDELVKLGFEHIRNAVIHIPNDQEKYFMDYDYSDATGGVISRIKYGSHVLVDEYIKKIRVAADAYFEVVITEDELKGWNEFRRESGQGDDPRLLTAKSIYYYLFSIGIGDIGISSFEPIDESQIKLLKRFSNVFDLAYKRFSDIKQAEAQTRESEIELALERVRAQAMGMHKSEEVGAVSDGLFSELNKFNLALIGCSIVLVDEEADKIELWRARTDISVKPFEKSSLSEMTKIMKKNMPEFHTKFIKALGKRKGFLIQELSGEKRSQFIDAFAEQYNYSSPEKNNFAKSVPEKISTHFVFFKLGYLALVSANEITAKNMFIARRFIEVFDFAYTRFLDIKQAEAQAREAQIEVALEKIRSRTIGMQNSAELSNVVTKVFREFKKLDIETLAADIIIFHDDANTANMWVSGLDGTEGPYLTRAADHPHQMGTLKAWQNKDLVRVTELNGEKFKSFFELGFSQTSGLKTVSKETKEFVFSLGRVFHTEAFTKHGCIRLASKDEQSEENIQILQRFAKVFEQTYTRFLDLQKAEAQAREAQIEAAIERVRAKSMAMHNSVELADLSFELVKQIHALGIDTWFCAFNIYDDDPQGSLEWGSNAQGTYEEYRTPREGIFLRYYEAGQSGDKLLINEIDENECPAHYEYLCSLPGVGEQLSQMKDAGISFPTYQIDHVAFFKYGYIIFITFEPVPESHEIFKRFAKVFEQTYTRFLDLKNAEEQAREAKIEAAMEKVRARAMSMQQPDELVEVTKLLRTEMGLLGVEELETSSIYIHDETIGTTECWFSIQDREDENKLISDYMIIDLNDTWVGREMLSFYKSEHNRISIVMKGNQRIEWISYCAEKSELFSPSGFYGDEIPDRTYHLHKFNNGFMGAAAPGDISKESWDLLNRCTSVFSLAYTRFRDLKKAQAQAREAQVETSLERVRSRSMGMQKSDELKDVIKTIFDQLTLLDINAEHAGIVVDFKPFEDWTFWIAENQDIPSQIKVPYLDSEWDRKYTDAKANGEEFFTVQLNYEEKNKFYKDLLSHIPDINKKEREFYFNCEGLAISTVVQKNVGLYVENFTGAPYSEEENKIVIRFGKVFQQTYTRFLDLQRAEEQAREAQIEAALERVRSKAMAMHNSEDLAATVESFFAELNRLNVKPHRCGVGIVDPEKRITDIKATTLTPDGEVKKITGILNLFGHPILDNIFKHWQKQEEYHPVLRGKEIKEYYKVMNPQITFPDFADDKIQYGYYFYFKEGGVFAWRDKEYTETELQIFRRYTSVLSLTYRRYIDLIKAEEQNKIIQAENERKTEELEEARELQLSMLPKNLPELEDYDIAVYMKTATEVGGDYYDFHLNKDGTLTVVLGDATGHGMKAGTMVTITKSLFNTLALSKDIFKTFKRMSQVIKDMKVRQLSMCLTMFKIADRKLQMSSAGMPPVFIYNAKEKSVEEYEFTGLPLGTILGYPYEVEELELNSGDTILLMSDGFPELLNEKEELYGYERTKKLFEHIAQDKPEQIIEKLNEKGSDWLNGLDQDDDVTFVVIKVKE
jgi:hypothetical protein